MTGKLAALEKESGQQLTALQEEILNLKQRLQVRQMSLGTDFQPFAKVFVPTKEVLYIRICWIRMFWGLLDPDPAPDPSIIKQKQKEKP